MVEGAGGFLRPGGGDPDERQAANALQRRRVGLPMSGRADQPETHDVPPLAASLPVVNVNSPRLNMDSGVVVREGPGIVTIGPTRRASRRPDLPLHPASEALIDGEHPGPLRR